MSLQHTTATTHTNAVPLPDSGVSSAFRNMLAPLIDSHHRHRITRTRKATRREIAHLPASLQQDLAFADGTVIALS